MLAPDRITLVLRPAEGSTLEKIAPFAEAGMSVAVGRSLAVVDAKIDGNLVMHAQAMLDLLRRINAKVGGYDAILHHGGNPSEQAWAERHKALADIWDLLDKVQGAAGTASPSGPSAESDLDELVQVALNDARYRFLRERQQLETLGDDLQVMRGDTCLSGNALDVEIDTLISFQRLEQVEDYSCAP